MEGRRAIVTYINIIRKLHLEHVLVLQLYTKLLYCNSLANRMCLVLYIYMYILFLLLVVLMYMYVLVCRWD